MYTHCFLHSKQTSISTLLRTMWASASSPSSSSSSSFSYSQFLQDFYSRKLLLNTPLLHASQGKAAMAATAAVVVAPPPITTSGGSSPTTGQGSIDSNIVMILSALLCALICALALNSIIRCALRCSSRAAIESGAGGLPRLANTGIKKKVLKTFPIVTYSPGMELPGQLDTECIICLSEFGPGERLRFLPKCNHGFHVRCIDKWLMSHSSCPTCRHCLINTCQKIEGSRGEGNSSQVLSAPQGSVAPLQPEGLIRNYRGVC